MANYVDFGIQTPEASGVQAHSRSYESLDVQLGPLIAKTIRTQVLFEDFGVQTDRRPDTETVSSDTEHGDPEPGFRTDIGFADCGVQTESGFEFETWSSDDARSERFKLFVDTFYEVDTISEPELLFEKENLDTLSVLPFHHILTEDLDGVLRIPGRADVNAQSGIYYSDPGVQTEPMLSMHSYGCSRS